MSNIKSVSLLPIFLQTDKNSKFLSGTLDQLIQPAELERLDGYIGSTITPTYNPADDVYLSENLELRRNYQLDPALVIKDSSNNIQDVQGLDDLINEITIKGGLTDNIDRILRSDTYSYDAHIDWDKLVNYQNYYWLPTGPDVIYIETDNLDVDSSIVGHSQYTTTAGVVLSNGMLISFAGLHVADKYRNKEFFVEGVGTSIVLVPFDKLIIGETSAYQYIDYFDRKIFDNFSFDGHRRAAIDPEYITINRASQDLNPWSRYNRWVHHDVIYASSMATGLLPEFPSESRAKRPIVEFNANLQLFNFGSTAIDTVDLFDDTTANAFSTIEGSTSTVLVDGIALDHGNRIIFNADTNPDVNGKIYVVNVIRVQGYSTITLVPAGDYQPAQDSSVNVLSGNKYQGTSWHYQGSTWKYSQQKTSLNQAPLFDLYDVDGNSYSDINYYVSNFTGNKIFGYKIGSGTNDAVLGFPLSYRNIDAVSSYLFSNYLTSENIIILQNDLSTYTIPTNITYCKRYTSTGYVYENAWKQTYEYPIPLISNVNSSTTFYEEPLGLTNNPLNGYIAEFTVSELTQHVNSMVNRLPGYSASSAGIGNLRDLSDYTKYGTYLISNANPIAFAQMFIGKKEHNVVDAITKSADRYNQFKFEFLNQISTPYIYDQLDPVAAVDLAMKEVNKNKSSGSAYHLSDMIGYGTDKIVRTFTVVDSRNKEYPLNSEYDLSSLSLRSVLIYHTSASTGITQQLIHGIDYRFNFNMILVEILIDLQVNDVITVNDYVNTEGVYIPTTPTKLRIYPKFIPSKYLDDTYITATNVIQGHDGSIIRAFNDYRDDIILELEKRIYNNIKAEYRHDLLDVNSILPGAFRTNKYSLEEINKILQQDFVKWAGHYGVDYTANNSFDLAEPKTWNYTRAYNTTLGISAYGSWRAVYKYFYDTDRPHTHPWEMLGFSEKPNWWDTKYGLAPYHSNNTMWADIEAGRINGVINSFYARPGLSSILPVDSLGNLLDPTAHLLTNIAPSNIQQPWVSGEQGTAETAWRRSSYWPYAVQKLLALTMPSTYATLMYDPSRVDKNIAGQWTYGTDKKFFRLPEIYISGENNVLTNGYSVLVAEAGEQRNNNYTTELRQDLNYVNYNLFHKVGGFVNKNNLQIIIDSYSPNTIGPGALLPQENYALRLNVSNPVKSIGISGFIIQKSNGNFIIKGYDRSNPFFTYYKSIRNSNTQAITVGGVSEPYVVWTASAGTGGATGLTDADLATANSAIVGNFYAAGQLVYYGNNFYRVQVAHRSGSTFNASYFQLMPELPTKGGAKVQITKMFEKVSTTISYGTTLSTIQEVYDLIIGYGRWLEEQGFVFDEYNKDLGSVIDWSLTAREFLFWTTQNWADNSIITLSPFADKIKYKFNQSVVDNIFDSFYEYSLLKADGSMYPQKSLSIARQDGICTISTIEGSEGIYFARLNSVQKEHAMVFDNTTIFGDVIYDIETGSRQRRMKLIGFRTTNWNGDYFSPGFVYDTAQVDDWKTYTDYMIGDVVRFNGNYYSAIKNINGSKFFNFDLWDTLGARPVAGLLPNFDYKINQFEDFYSLDIDNFDAGQQKMAQHLTGYTPRPYLNGLFTDPIAQYKFYQGFIREKGTKNALTKIAKANVRNLQGDISFNEEWAFRVGNYGSFPSYQEIEVPLAEGSFIENPQIVNFVDSTFTSTNNLIYYVKPAQLTITPDDYVPSNTFVSTSSEDVFLLTHSGFVRIDDVTATAYNENSLLDIANNGSLVNGDTIWLGFKQNGGWDVYRYTYVAVGVTGVYISSPVSEITFTTDAAHGLTAGEIISVSQFNDQVNGVYLVNFVPNSKQFVVSSTLASIANAVLESPGHLYKFSSARIDKFDSLPSDKMLYNMPAGTKFWVDSSPTSVHDWAVHEKIVNFNYAGFINNVLTSLEQGSGKSISKRKGNDILIIGAPLIKIEELDLVPYYPLDPPYVTGEVFVYRNISNDYSNVINFKFNKYPSIVSNEVTEYGYCVVYDDIEFGTSTYGLTFAGAPGYSNNKGAVKISSINNRLLEEGVSTHITATNYSKRFGSSIFVQRNTGTKLTLIGAPDVVNGSTKGLVEAYTVSDISGNISVSYISSLTNSSIKLTSGSQWGYSIAGTDDASYVAIGAPGYFTNTGVVTIFNHSLTRLETILSPFGAAGRFGETISMSPTGEYLFIAAPGAVNSDLSYGAVAVYKGTANTFTLDHVLENPVPLFNGQGMNFGKAIDINSDNNMLVISAQGVNESFPTIFDGNSLTFDNGITEFIGSQNNSGAVYVYHREYDRFVFAEELSNSTIATTAGTDFGSSVAVDTNTILVGAPAYDNTFTSSGVYQFDKIDPTQTSWNKIRSASQLVTLDSLQRISLINTDKEKIVEYLDLIDPLKGKIAGKAEQELTYKLISDPAIYSIGLAGTVNDTNTNWLDSHVGELWWDLSTAKYLWYEQSDLEYRKNNWGKLFPGATIDVYEWVGSTLLPSEWSTQADTSSGLTQGISGQPRYPDNSVISVKQIYDPVSNNFSNMYYYWVKNKITVPDAKNRRISSYEVASIIADPTAYGLKFASVIAPNSVALANIGSMLVNSTISLNIAQDIAKDSKSIPRHTEWLILQENSAKSMPNALLEKKLIDSLVGHDSLGNKVPNANLSDRTKYGIGIRPQQSLFKDRLAALRNIVEFTNSVLIDKLITGNYNFANLNSQELPPDSYSKEYDSVVEDNNELSSIDTSLYQPARIRCDVDTNGNIINTTILDAGYGYGTLHPKTVNNQTVYDGPPLIISTSSGSGAVISTNVNSAGEIISSEILSSGSGYTGNFTIYSRPQTIIVLSDSTYNGKWTKYEFDNVARKWIRAHTQIYNTPLYWNYVDWVSPDYNNYQDFLYTVGDMYEVSELDLSVGDYVKVKNQGDGRFIILKKIADGQPGTFSTGFDILYSEKGTIQISNDIWDLPNSNYNWDSRNTYDQTLWDQTADIELQYIIKALRDDLFINDLRVNWNLLFFKAVKYAMTEQKLLDWAFKTSFISVTNNVGILDQRLVYKLQNISYYEDYIKEIKPYHTQIRNFISSYSSLDYSNTHVADFDLPSTYDRTTGKFISVTANNTLTNQYPWKDWKSVYLLPDNPVRKNILKMKFDRTSKVSQIGNRHVIDTFIANGYTSEFVLNWLPQPDKVNIIVKLDGILQLSEDYKVVSYQAQYIDYNKKYSKIVFLNDNPAAGQIITVEYNKSNELFNATDRILNSYTATSGMPGVDLGQLMTGIEYPGISLDGVKDANGIATFRNFSDSEVDTVINRLPDGATYATFDLTTISGIDPYDLILDGEYNFITPNTSYAPEEVVPGQVLDSLGISVYTKNQTGAPLVFNYRVNVDISAVNQSFVMTALPISIDNITVIYDGKILEYVTTVGGLIAGTFTILWETQTLVIPPQTVAGVLGYTIIDVGGGSGLTAGVIDKGYSIATNATEATVKSLASVESVASAFVTVNGVAISQVTTTSNYGYMLTYVDDFEKRAAVRVYNLQPGYNTIQAWFFADAQSNFNVMHEQEFVIASGSTDNALSLIFPPGNQIEPLSAQAIVELTDEFGTRRLLPPDVEYYSVTDVNNPVFPLPAGITISQVNVYKNGSKLRPGFEFTVGTSLTIDHVAVQLTLGDAIAIEICTPTILGTSDPVSTTTAYSYDYRIVGNNLYLAPGVQPQHTIKTLTNAKIRVITYTNSDQMLLRTEQFKGTKNRRFKISRPVYNDNYIWATLIRPNTAGVPPTTYGLINKIDFIVLDDGLTVQISDKWNITSADTIEIITFGSQKLASTVLGYRMFIDLAGKTSFTRLSSKNTTYLTRPLAFTDTEIYVDDSSVLTFPIVSKNIPGVVIIDGERIEFFQANSNVLSQLRRSTMGTAPAYYLEPGTRVLDQGADQLIQYSETIRVQNTFTNTLTNTHIISKVSLANRTNPLSTLTVVCDGIKLSTATSLLIVDPLTNNTISNVINPLDQVEVFYGGKRLNKHGYYRHDTTVAYDSIPLTSILGTVTSATNLSTSTNVGDAYLALDSNKVWVYTGLDFNSNVTQGYKYSGLKYVPADFEIVNTATQTLVLNTATLGVSKNISITLVKKDIAVASSWNNIDPSDTTKTLSLFDSDTAIAKFLKNAPAELPNVYYYGGDIDLTDEGGNPLFDDNGNDLKGYY